jgi:hypothetical protein
MAEQSQVAATMTLSQPLLHQAKKAKAFVTAPFLVIA